MARNGGKKRNVGGDGPGWAWRKAPVTELGPEGVKVFLELGEAERFDEWKEGEPYGDEADFRGRWHQNRIRMGIEMVLNAAAGFSGPVRILDLGCGPVQVTFRLTEAIPGARVCALDHSLSALKRVGKRCPGVELVLADALDLPCEDGSFDIVLSLNLYEHVHCPVLLLEEVRRVLAPGGALVLSTPSRYRWRNVARILRRRQVSFMSSSHVTEYSIGQVREMLAYSGFVVERVDSVPALRKGRSVRRLPGRAVEVLANVVARRVLRDAHSLSSTVFFLARKGKERG